jgi:hypothetical protein
MHSLNNDTEYSSFNPAPRCFRARKVTYFHTLTFSARMRLVLSQNINTLSRYYDVYRLPLLGERAGVRGTVVAFYTSSFLLRFSPHPNPLPKGEGTFKSRSTERSRSTPPLFLEVLYL